MQAQSAGAGACATAAVAVAASLVAAVQPRRRVPPARAVATGGVVAGDCAGRSALARCRGGRGDWVCSCQRNAQLSGEVDRAWRGLLCQAWRQAAGAGKTCRLGERQPASEGRVEGWGNDASALNARAPWLARSQRAGRRSAERRIARRAAAIWMTDSARNWGRRRPWGATGQGAPWRRRSKITALRDDERPSSTPSLASPHP